MSAEEIDRLALENDRLEGLVRDLAQERAGLEAAAADGHKAADNLRRAGRSANEAAGWIANEAARLRR